MGSVISQQKCPVPYWSRKLTETQQNYHTVEKELLSITMVLEEFCSMLLGTEHFIYTDHKNLTFVMLNCCCVLSWWSYVEEYGPTILYHPGKKNIIANTFSQLPHCDVLPIPVGENAPVVLLDFTSEGLNISNDPDLLKCFFNLPLPKIQKPTLSTLRGYIHKRTRVPSWLQKQLSTQTNTSIRLLMVMSLSVMPFQMRMA